MTYLLAQAAPPASSWPGALVAIVAALVPVAMAVIQLLRERAKRKEAEVNLETVVEGVERSGDTKAKVFIRDTAKQRGDKTLAGKVEKITKRLTPLLLLGALLFSLAGCCTFDHESAAAYADQRAAVCERIAARPDDRLPPALAREFAREEAASWRLQADRIREREDTSSRARIEGPQ